MPRGSKIKWSTSTLGFDFPNVFARREPVSNTISRPSASVSRMIMKPLKQFQKYSPDTVIRVQDAGELVLGRTGGDASYRLLSVFVREMKEETGTRGLDIAMS